MVAPASQSHPIIPPNTRVAFVSPQTGVLTNTGLQLLQQTYLVTNGLLPTIPCEAANTGNVYTLTPLLTSPKLLGYFSFQAFAWVAPATSTGLVTANVVPTTGTLPTLPVYINHGATQATSADITINLFYVMYYVDTLNSGNGGFVIV